MRHPPFVVILALAGLAACESSSGPSNPGPPARMEIVSGDAQAGTAGQELPNPLVVRVLDADDQPVAGQIVNFVVVSGGGSVFAGGSQTNAQGEARERWTLGSVAGDTQRVEARAVNPSTGEALVFAEFTAVASSDASASVQPLRSPPATAPVGAALPEPVEVRVVDQYGNGVANVAIAWSISPAGGTVTPLAGATDAEGIAGALVALGARLDSTYVVTASTAGTVPVTFSVIPSLAGSGAVLSSAGSGQQQVVAEAYPDPLVVRLTLPDGRGVEGAPVAWDSVTGAVGSPFTHRLSSDSATDAAGEARAVVNAGRLSGAVRWRATVAGNTASFALQALAGPPAMFIDGGGVAVPTGSTWPTSYDGAAGSTRTVSVRVADEYRNFAPGVKVRWTVVEGSGSLADSISTTATNGQASVAWTIAGRIGDAQRVSASVDGLGSLFFEGEVTSAGAAVARRWTADAYTVRLGSSIVAGTQFEDAYGNLFGINKPGLPQVTVETAGVVRAEPMEGGGLFIYGESIGTTRIFLHFADEITDTAVVEAVP